MTKGDRLIVWSQLMQSLRLARYLRDSGIDELVFQYDDDNAIYSRRYKAEGVTWCHGDDLDSPEAHALLSAFHLVFR